MQCRPQVVSGNLFGDFALVVSHSNPARRLECLRAGVSFLLKQSVPEFDFENSKSRAYWRRVSYSRNANAQQLALQIIYQKYSPLHQVLSVGEQEFSEPSFDRFDAWLRRIRELKLITFSGKTALLESLDVPIIDPMILQLVTSMKSLRVPSGVLFFDGDSEGVPSLIMVSLDPHDSNPVDKSLANRWSCSLTQQSHPRIASAGNAIAEVTCNIFDWFGDLWLGMAVTKSDDFSYPDFCHQVGELTNDADVAAVIRGSPEGLKGSYVLLPLKCEAQE